jgi:hypothetical protein
LSTTSFRRRDPPRPDGDRHGDVAGPQSSLELVGPGAGEVALEQVEDVVARIAAEEDDDAGEIGGRNRLEPLVLAVGADHGRARAEVLTVDVQAVLVDVGPQVAGVGAGALLTEF